MTSKGILSSKLDVMVSVLRGSGIKKDYDFDVKDEVLLHTHESPHTDTTTCSTLELRRLTPTATGGEREIWNSDAGRE